MAGKGRRTRFTLTLGVHWLLVP